MSSTGYGWKANTFQISATLDSRAAESAWGHEAMRGLVLQTQERQMLPDRTVSDSSKQMLSDLSFSLDKAK